MKRVLAVAVTLTVALSIAIWTYRDDFSAWKDQQRLQRFYSQVGELEAERANEERVRLVLGSPTQEISTNDHRVLHYDAGRYRSRLQKSPSFIFRSEDGAFVAVTWVSYD